MNLSFRTLAVLCSVAISLNTGCAGRDILFSSDGNSESPLVMLGGSVAQETVLRPETALTEDYVPAGNADCFIAFDEENITVEGDGVHVANNTVTITRDGVYSLSGASGDGRIVVKADNVSLILNGLILGSTNGTVLEYTGGGKLLLTVSAQSENRLSVSGKSALAGSGDITVNGDGRLFLTGDNGIVCDGVLKLCGGDIDISSNDDGISGSSYVLLAGANAAIRSGGDGIRVNGRDDLGYISVESGKLDIKSSSDGVQTDNGLFVSGGEVLLSCGGGSSAVMHLMGEKHSYGRHGGYFTDGSKAFDFSDLVSGDGSKVGSKKGFRSGGRVEIVGGLVDINSADDSIYASGDVIISGGEVRLSTGDDGIHSDKRVTISDGALTVSNSYAAIEGMAVEAEGGRISLTSFHDGIIAAGGNDIDYTGNLNEVSQRYISISGGELEIYAGGDGLDSNGTAAMSGGNVVIFADDDEKFGSLCYTDSFALSGGTLAAFGSDGATKAPSMVSRPCISVFAKAEQGSRVELIDDTGVVVFNIVMPKRCDSMVFSANGIAEGKSYSVYVDDVLLTTVAATGGGCGDGPNGRDMGLFDDLINGTQGNSNTAIA